MLQRWWHTGTLLLLLAGRIAIAQSASADPQSYYGPLRSRDLSPFGYLRLDMRPTLPQALQPGQWAVESELAYQNTWALSDNVKRYLESFPARRELTSADVEAIRQLGGESYLVDLELAEFDLTLHRQLTADWGTFLILGGVSYDGGVLDGAIEQFHAAFGLPESGRPALSRNRLNVIFDLKSTHYVGLDMSPRGGLLDPTLGLRYTGLQLPAPWSLAVEAATRIPIGGARDWLSTGRTDVGLQASLLRRGTRHAFYSSVSMVAYAGSDSALEPGAKLLPTVVLGLDSHLTRRTHSIMQFYASPSVYGSRETSLDELRANKYELSLGLRHQRGSQLWSFALTENIASFNNTPDIVMQLGWSYRPLD